jgi:hypothetical protein
MTTVATPTDLYFFRPSRGLIALSWRINPVTGEDTDIYDFEVQTDSVDTFNSANLKSYDKNNSGVIAYQDGEFFKAFIFKEPSSLVDFSLYFRVKVQGFYTSSWSTSLKADLNKVDWYDDSNMLAELVPDKNVYSKDGLLNSYKVIEAYCREIQDLKQESERVNDGSNFYKTQDSDLQDVLGAYLEYTRDTGRPFIEYRRELLELWSSFLLAGTESGIKKFIKSLMGIDPEIDTFKDIYGWIVHDEQSLPYAYQSDAWSINNAHFYVYDQNWISTVPTLRPVSRGDKGFSWILKIYNPFLLNTRHAFIESVVNKLKPANTKVYFEYYHPAAETYPIYWGNTWYWGNLNYWSYDSVSWV